MKKKVFVIAVILFSSFAFTACEEEIIRPNNTTETDGTAGDKKDDSGEWD